MKRKEVRLATFAALFVLLSLTGTSAVSAGSLRVDPGRISADQPLPPGQTIHLPIISITNDMGFDVIIAVTVSDYEDEERVLPPEDWFSMTPAELEIPAGETGQMEIAVTVPQDAFPHSYKMWFQYKSEAALPTTGVTHVLSMRTPFIFDVKAMDYTITLSAEGEGTLNPAPGDYTHHQGSELQLSAEPGEGWQFSHWAGLPMHADSEYTHTVTDDIEITAVFERQEFQVTITDPEGEGTISPEPGNYTHKYEDEVELSADPSDLWKFERWEGPVADEGSPQTTLTVTGDTKVTPIFAELQLEGLRIEPSSLQLAPENTSPVQVFAVYEDGTEVDVTGDAAWVLRDDEVATYADGELTAQQVGETLLIAEYQEFMVESSVQVEETPVAASVYPWFVLAAIVGVGGFIVYRKRNRSGVR